MKSSKRWNSSVFSGLFCFFTSCASTQYPVSDHYDGKMFFNPGRNNDKKSFLDLLKWKRQGTQVAWPDWVDDLATPQVASEVKSKEAVLTFVNHATYLIQIPGLNIITDPVFSKRVSPLSWIGPARHRPPGVPFESLPPIHVVFVSHNHYDHLDSDSIQKLENAHHPLFITPLGNKTLLEKAGAKNVIELDWWQKTDLPTKASLTVTQVQHWSSRSLSDRNQALWGGFVLESDGMKIYFSGDSGYGPHYKETHRRFGPMDVSLLPIGAYEPRWFMTEQHMNPAEAVQAHQDLHSRQSFAIHFGTFQLTDEGIEQPVIDLQKALVDAKVDTHLFVAPKNGQTDRAAHPLL